MKKTIYLLLTALAAIASHASIITGPILDPQTGTGATTTITLQLRTPVVVNVSNVFFTKAFTIAVTSGAFTTAQLPAGNWNVQIGPRNDLLQFSLPNDTNTYTLGQLLSASQTFQFISSPVYLLKNGDVMLGNLGFSGSTNAGLILNSLTTTQRNNLTGTNGMVVYDSTLNQVWAFQNGAWSYIAATNGLSQYAAALFVAKNGNDSTANRGDLPPFLTIRAAVNKSLPGDTIYVYAGTYNETDLLTNGVNYFGYPGANIIYQQTTTNDAGYGIFDDRHCGPTTNQINWQGNMFYGYWTNNDLATPNTNTLGPIVVANPTSVINLNFNKIQVSGVREDGCLTVENGTLWATGNELSDPFYQIQMNVTNHTLTNLVSHPRSKSDAVVWNYGVAHITVGDVFVNNYGLWGSENGFNTIGQTNSDMYLNFNLMRSTIYIDCGSSNYRSWVVGKELACVTNSQATANFSTAKYYGGGKHYLNLQKLGSVDNSAVSTSQGNGCLTLVAGVTAPLASNQVVWANIEKISASNCWVNTSSGTLFLNCQQFEDLGAVTNGIVTTNNAVVSCDFMNMKVLSGVGVFHASGGSGGRVDLWNGVIDTSAGAATNDYPIFLTSSNCYLHNLVLVSPASTQPIYAASNQTNGIYGNVVANNNTNNFIRFVPAGTFTVDANVK